MCPKRRTRCLGFTVLACLSMTTWRVRLPRWSRSGPRSAAGGSPLFEVEFLAPDGAALEATAKALVRGAPSPAQNAVTISIDGKSCADARCPFQARKGETYKLAAATKLRNFEELCIVVARP